VHRAMGIQPINPFAASGERPPRSPAGGQCLKVPSMLGEERQDGLIISVRIFARHRVRTSRNNNPLAVRQASLQLIVDPEK